MRRLSAVSFSALAVLLACSATTAPPSDAPAADPAAATPADGAPSEVADAGTKSKADEEAEKQALLEKRIADRLARAEKAAAQKKARWTPELSAQVNKLMSKRHRNLDAGLKKILASEHRTEGAADRDQYRHPRETLRFFGLKPKDRKSVV